MYLTMKLLCIFVAVLAVSLAEESDIPESHNNDASAVTPIELLKVSDSDEDTLQPAASAHHYASNTKSWNPHYNIPSQYNSGSVSDYVPPVSNYVSPVSNYVSPASDYVSPVSHYVPRVSNYVPPVSNYVPPVSNYVPPVNNYVPPRYDHVPPKNSYVPPLNPPHFWNKYFPTSTSSSIIKNEYTHGDNGSYKYEYQITDGTHVGETGYFTNLHQTDDSLVKKGWYSYVGADGKTRSVYYWADHTGYHVYTPTNSHFPYSAEAEKSKPQPIHPTQPTYNPHHH